MLKSAKLNDATGKYAFRYEARQLFALAVPVIMTQLAQRMIGITDVLFLGTYGPQALGGAALALAVYYGLLFLAMGPSGAVSTILAQQVGRGEVDPSAMGRTLAMGFWAAACIALPAMLLLQFTTDLLLLFGEPPALARAGGEFGSIIGTSLLFILSFDILRSYASVLGRPILPFLVIAASVFVNASVGYTLVFGQFGFPEMGLRGAAIASWVANAFSFVTLAILIAANPALRIPRFISSLRRPDWARFVEIFRLGLPIGLALLFEVLFFTSGTLAVGHFGTASIAAHQIAMTVTATTFIVPLGIAAAATIRVGIAAGSGDGRRARSVALTALSIGAGFAMLCTIAIAAAPEVLAAMFVGSDPDDQAVVDKAVIFLYFAAAFQVLDAAQVVANFSLRGLKDTFVPMLLAGGSYWLVGFPLAIGLAFAAQMEGAGVWFAYMVALAAAAVSLWARLIKQTRKLLAEPGIVQ